MTCLIHFFSLSLIIVNYIIMYTNKFWNSEVFLLKSFSSLTDGWQRHLKGTHVPLAFMHEQWQQEIALFPQVCLMSSSKNSCSFKKFNELLANDLRRRCLSSAWHFSANALYLIPISVSEQLLCRLIHVFWEGRRPFYSRVDCTLHELDVFLFR